MKSNDYYQFKDGTYDNITKREISNNYDPCNEKDVIQLCKRYDIPYMPEEWHNIFMRYFPHYEDRKMEYFFGRYLAKMKLASFKDYRFKDSLFLFKTHQEVQLNELKNLLKETEDVCDILTEVGKKFNISEEEMEKMAENFSKNPREPAMKEQVSHPTHYQGSCAESWDLSVLEWGPEYAIAAWVVQAQQYYDRHKGKNGVQDLEKALTFLDHALATDKYFRDNTLKDIPMHDGFWEKATFLRTLIIRARDEEDQ